MQNKNKMIIYSYELSSTSIKLNVYKRNEQKSYLLASSLKDIKRNLP